MPAAQLKTTTVDPEKRTLAREEEDVAALVERLMGRKPEERFRFIQDNAEFVGDELDV